MAPVEQWQNTIVTFFITYGFRVVGALIILAVGALIARWLGGLTDKWLKQHLEPPIRILMVRVVRLIVFGLAVVLALDKFGVQIAPLIAGIGLAAQGVLGNVIAGLTIIFTKPFRVGKYIEMVGVNGQVTNIELFSTTLLHSDNSRVVIPNRKIVGEILHNCGNIRQLNLSVGIAYNSDVKGALATVHEILNANARVLKDPQPVVGIEALAASAITIGILPWVAVPDHGPAQLEIYEAIIKQFRARGIEIPFPQREVRLLQKASA